MISNEDRGLVELIRDKGWIILNSYLEEGLREYTYSGARGSSVFDYIIANDECLYDVINFKVERRVHDDDVVKYHSKLANVSAPDLSLSVEVE